MARIHTAEYCYEMGITRAEFLRLLPAAVGHTLFRHHGDVLLGSSDWVDWRIVLDERSKRHIALLSLPVLHVTITLNAETPQAIEWFIARFLLAHQRAGG
jgi:hypothetical protein